MAARVPRVWNAALNSASFSLPAYLGLLRMPLWALPVLAVTMIAYWIVNRRVGLAQLGEMGGGRLRGAALVSVALIVAVLGGTYWLGSLLSGRTL